MQATANLNIEQVLEKQGYAVCPVRGDSMLPMLDQKKDLVKLVPVSGTLSKYDLPLYRRPNGKLVLHRIIGVRRGYYITCGDNRTVSEKVPFEWVIAVAEGYYKSGKYIPIDDGEYLKYVRKHCRGRWRRKIITRDAGQNVFSRKEELALIALLRYALTGDTDAVALEKRVCGVDMARIYRLADRQGVVSAAWYAAKKLPLDEKLKNAWSSSSDAVLRREILFDAERQAILREFDEQGIGYVLLKGIIQKELWPCRGMREFSDNDILIDPERRDDVEKIMIARGYSCEGKGEVHDCYHRQPMFNFEMHIRLFPETFKFAGSFEDVFRKCEPFGDGAERRMPADIGYAYILAHMYEHYDSSGAGLRTYADLWLNYCRSEAEGEDRAGIIQTLRRVGIDRFEEKALRIAGLIFKGDPGKFTEKELNSIFCGGVYGKRENKAYSDVQKKGRVGYFFYRLFMPYPEMKRSYPVLNKCPLLLPLCYIHRLGNALLYKRSRIQAEMKAITDRTTDAKDD